MRGACTYLSSSRGCLVDDTVPRTGDGRTVRLTMTRDDRLEDINTHCLEEFRKHWKCLDNENHQLWQCRPEEWKLNKCAYDKLVSSCPAAVFSGVFRGIYLTIHPLTSGPDQDGAGSAQELDARPPAHKTILRPYIHPLQ